MKKSINSKAKGFTIVELLVVIVVIGILAAISIVSYSGVANKAKNVQALTVASDIKSGVEFAASENSGNYNVTLDTIKGFIALPAESAELISSVPTAPTGTPFKHKFAVKICMSTNATYLTAAAAETGITNGADIAKIEYWDVSKTSGNVQSLIAGKQTIGTMTIGGATSVPHCRATYQS